MSRLQMAVWTSSDAQGVLMSSFGVDDPVLRFLIPVKVAVRPPLIIQIVRSGPGPLTSEVGSSHQDLKSYCPGVAVIRMISSGSNQPSLLSSAQISTPTGNSNFKYISVLFKR